MKDSRSLFTELPDTAIITDAYGYVLDYNHIPESMKLKKGMQLLGFMPYYMQITEDEFSLGSLTFHRKVTPILRNNNLVGYTILLSDITAAKKLIEQQKVLFAKQKELISETQRINERLESYALQAKGLSDYEEQLLLARRIHDDSGHAITAIHTICQMCLSLIDEDPKTYEELIKEGIEICERAGNENSKKQASSMEEILLNVKRECRFPIEITIEGAEPSFAKPLYETLDRICREAYHNTIDHSLADTLYIHLSMTENCVTLKIEDNGKFHGEFVKGFGLSMMEENVRKSMGTVEFVAKTGQGFGILVTWRKENEG